MEFTDSVTEHKFEEREFIGIRATCKANDIGKTCGEILPKAYKLFAEKKKINT